MKSLIPLLVLIITLNTSAQNELSFTINQERKLFAKIDNHVTVGGTEGIQKLGKVICSDCDTIYQFGKNTVYVRPKKTGRVTVDFIVENTNDRTDTLSYTFIVEPYPVPLLNLGNAEHGDTLKGIINRIWVHQPIESPFTGMNYSVGNMTVKVGDTVFNSKNKVLPEACIRYLQLLNDTTLILISAHYKGPFREEGNISSTFVAPPFLPTYIRPTDSRCEGVLDDLDHYKFRYSLKVNAELYWIYSIKSMNTEDLTQILKRLQGDAEIETLENQFEVKIRTLE
ncbi:hypothetical protein SAMN05216474_2069 [Lishizhenia tianjinensis]|uniref:Uncharacterized protein n=1 Tax=Lishizhenia tianjinensis TaxID=477690 RepID=A0A1I7AGJ6_9FLAO|nr:hypothetical protein [Lishizhenia tianjinensis]SFT74044.1 hypothetical protein SAMN05216474_2069 [Lishizhenia tianjinensis]